MIRPSWDEYFLQLTQVISTRSHDAETKVGAVIVDKKNRILATGYNGFPPGVFNTYLPTNRPEKYNYMIHAEINAIIYAKRDLKGSTLYCTHSPCIDCAKGIITAGIEKVVYIHPYSEVGLSLLNLVGIQLQRLEN